MKRSCFLLISCFATIVTAQLFGQEITFSSQGPFSNGSVILFPNTSNEPGKSTCFVVTGANGPLDLSNSPRNKGEKQIDPEISYYENSTVVNKSKLTLETPNGKARFMGMSALGDKSIVFLRQKDEGYVRCYYQYYDKTCEAISEPILLSEKKMEEGFFGNFFYGTSENQQFICLQYIQRNTRKMSDSEISFELFDRNLRLMDHGDYSSLGVNPEDDIFSCIVGNDGSLLIGVGHKRLNNKGKLTDELETFKVYRQLSGKVSYWESNIPYTKVSEVDMLLSPKDDQVLYLAGMGFEGESKDSKFAFYMKYDLKNRKELSNVKNVINFETFMYQPRKIFEQDNGLVFVTERAFGGASTTMSMNTGSATTTPKDYFNTVLCFKVEEGSKMVPWNAIIDKQQVFMTSTGLSKFGSIQVVEANKRCFIFFNDNAANYNEQGDYNATEKTLEKFDGKQEKKLWLNDKGLAMVEVNLSDGKLKRTLLTKDKGIVNIRGNCCITSTGSSIIFFLQKNELGQVGWIKF